MSEKVTFGLAEPYLKDIKEAKDVFTFLQSKTYNPLTPDQDKQLKEVRMSDWIQNTFSYMSRLSFSSYILTHSGRLMLLMHDCNRRLSTLQVLPF